MTEYTTRPTGDSAGRYVFRSVAGHKSFSPTPVVNAAKVKIVERIVDPKDFHLLELGDWQQRSSAIVTEGMPEPPERMNEPLPLLRLVEQPHVSKPHAEFEAKPEPTKTRTREGFTAFVREQFPEVWNTERGTIRDNQLLNLAIANGFAGLLPQGFDKIKAEGDPKKAEVARKAATCIAPLATRKGDHRKGRAPRKDPIAVKTVNDWIATRPNLRRVVWDLRQFHTLRDCLEYDDMQILRGEYMARKVELDRLLKGSLAPPQSLAFRPRGELAPRRRFLRWHLQGWHRLQ